jgi:hypothetical protein
MYGACGTGAVMSTDPANIRIAIGLREVDSPWVARGWVCSRTSPQVDGNYGFSSDNTVHVGDFAQFAVLRGVTSETLISSGGRSQP